MKRVLAMISLLFLLLSSLYVPVFAATTHELDELGLQVTIPSGYSVITKDTPANDPIFKELETTKTALLEQFEKSGIYLNAVADTYSDEIVVTMQEIAMSNFSLLSDTVLETLASTLADQYAQYGITVIKNDIYHHKQAKFIKIYWIDFAGDVYGLQFYTIYDGKAMNFTMRSYEGGLSEKQENTIQTIVDSIQYDNAPPASEPGDDTEAFIYTDSESGVMFTVPANWKQEEFSEEREYLDAKFVSTKEAGCGIMYGSSDTWESLPASDKEGYTREDVYDFVFTERDVAEMYNVSEDEITTVTYNGIEYFKIEGKFTSSSDGIGLSITSTRLLLIDRGWMYTFTFSAPSTHELYSDFEKMMKSVKYPMIPDGEEGNTESKLTDTDSKNSYKSNKESVTDDINWYMCGIIAVVGIVAIVLAVAISRKKQFEEEHMQMDPSSKLQPKEATIITVVCKKCGQALPSDSEFCHICGTKIEKE